MTYYTPTLELSYAWRGVPGMCLLVVSLYSGGELYIKMDNETVFKVSVVGPSTSSLPPSLPPSLWVQESLLLVGTDD